MTIDISVLEKVTLPASGPGEIATVTVTASGDIGTNNTVSLTIEGTRPVTATGDSFNVYVESIIGKIITIKANRPQTPQCTINVVVMEDST